MKWLTVLALAVLSASCFGATYTVDQLAPAADDQNPGTPDKPLKTLQAGVARLQRGDTLSIRSGVYRETLLLEARKFKGGEGRITVEAAPGQQVVLSGADLIKGWEKLEDPKKRPLWRKTPWAAWAKIKQAADNRSEGPQVVVDNQLYVQAASLDTMVPGSFYWDNADAGALYLWMLPPRAQPAVTAPGAEWWDTPTDLSSDDPNRHAVEVAVRNVNLHVRQVPDVTVRGLQFRHNTAHPQNGALSVASDGAIIEDCVVEFSHGKGLHVAGDRITVRRNYFRYNGGLGVGGTLTNSLFEDNVLAGNCTFGFGHSWEAGGVKFSRAWNLTVRRNQFLNNDGPGLWFDYCNNGNVVEQNFCADNSGSGIMMEVTPQFATTQPDTRPAPDPYLKKVGLAEKFNPDAPNVLRNNICVNNRWDGTWGSGIVLQLSSNTYVLNNTVMGNEQYGIFLRYHPYNNFGARVVDNVLLNNLCVDNGGSQIYIPPDPRDKPGYLGRNRSDYNLMFLSASWLNRNFSTQRPDYFGNRSLYARWGKTQLNASLSVEEWFKIYGYDEHSLQGDPQFVAPSTQDFRLRPDSPAIAAGSGETLVRQWVKDDFLGRPRPAGRVPSIGALEYFPEKPALPPMPMTSPPSPAVNTATAAGTP